MVLLIRRAKLQHLVWRLPPSPPSPPSPPASSTGTAASTSTAAAAGGTAAGSGTGGAAGRVLSCVELHRFIMLALPSACVMRIDQPLPEP